MADKTGIEWTDATWNPITGCSVVSPGCTNCYAMKLAGTRMKHEPSRIGLTDISKAGPVWNGQVRFNEQWLDQPLRWKKPRMVFVCAHGDLFHENVPADWIDEVFRVMATSPQHTFQVLTKRPERMRRYIQYQADYLAQLEWPVWPLPNVWLGVSVEDQQRANERISLLLQTPAAVRWLSCEPLLGPVDLRAIPHPLNHPNNPVDPCLKVLSPAQGHLVDWVVVGGESGSGARPMHPAWARSLRDQCADAGVPFFFKQWGEWGPKESQYMRNGKPEPDVMAKLGKKKAGSVLDGVEHKEWPA